MPVPPNPGEPRNAEYSTEPRSVAGKARASRNSLAHHLTAAQVCWTAPRIGAFEALRANRSPPTTSSWTKTT